MFQVGGVASCTVRCGLIGWGVAAEWGAVAGCE